MSRSSRPSPPENGRGRPRGFDETKALDAALDLFWDQGYEATSLDDLTKAMGLSRSSFYASFGSKHDVMMAALRQYSENSLEKLRRIEAEAASPLDAVRGMIEAIADPTGGDHGCLLVNCITELGPHDGEVRQHGHRHLDRMEAMMKDALARDDPKDARKRARALMSLALGATTLRKSGMSPARVKAALSAGDSLLRPD